MPSLQDVGVAVKRLQWHHHREGNRRLTADTGLSLVQWDVLRHLLHTPDASLHTLAEQTFQTDQSMGELARRMVARGLLARVEGPGRAVHHTLTAEGLAAHEAGAGIFDGVLRETVGALSVHERETLFALLEKARTGGEDTSDGPTS